MFSAVGAAALEKLIAQALKMDPDRAAVVRQLNSKVVAIDLRGPGLKFFLQFDGEENEQQTTKVCQHLVHKRRLFLWDRIV